MPKKPISATYDLHGATVAYTAQAGASAPSAKAELKLAESGAVSYDGDPATALRNIARKLRSFAEQIEALAKEVEA